MRKRVMYMNMCDHKGIHGWEYLNMQVLYELLLKKKSASSPPPLPIVVLGSEPGKHLPLSYILNYLVCL